MISTSEEVRKCHSLIVDSVFHQLSGQRPSIGHSLSYHSDCLRIKDQALVQEAQYSRDPISTFKPGQNGFRIITPHSPELQNSPPSQHHLQHHQKSRHLCLVSLSYQSQAHTNTPTAAVPPPVPLPPISPPRNPSAKPSTSTASTSSTAAAPSASWAK